MKKIVIVFLLFSGSIKVFSQQSLDQDLTTLMSKKRSQVNALAKIIVDENGKITIEHIKNSQTKELSEDAEGNESALKQMDPNSKSENETNSRTEIKSVDKYPTELENVDIDLPLDLQKIPLDRDNTAVSEKFQSPYRIITLDKNAQYKINEHPSQKNKLNERSSFSQSNSNLINQNSRGSNNLFDLGLEYTSEKAFMDEKSNEIRRTSQSQIDKIPQRAKYTSEKEPEFPSNSIEAVQARPGNYQPALLFSNESIISGEKKVNNSQLTEQIIENIEQNENFSESNLKVYNAENPSAAFQDELLNALGKVSSEPDLTLDTIYYGSFSIDTATNAIESYVYVANYGTVASGKFSFSFIISANKAGTNRYDFPFPVDTLSSLAAGSSHKFTLDSDLDEFQDLPTGSYYLTFSIDPFDEVKESNESNNLWYFTSSISYSGDGQPNLFVYERTGSLNQVTYDPLTQSINDIYLSIGNDGKVASNPTSISYYLSSNTTITSSDAYLGWAFVPKIKRGAYLVTVLESPIELGQSTTIPAGEWYLGAIIDQSLNVNESDETDNKFYFENRLKYNNYSGLPDLTLYTSGDANTFSYNTTSQELEITVGVLNDGDAASGSYNVGWYLSENTYITPYDNLIDDSYGHWLNSKSYRTHADTFDLDLYKAHIPSDTFYLGFIIDYVDQVEELKEDNNTYYWTSPTIPYQSNALPALRAFMNFGGYNHFNYDTVTSVLKDVYLSVENNGTGAAGSFYVDWYLSYNKTITSADFYLGDAFINRLSAGGYTDGGLIDSISLNLLDIPDGSYYLGARIDADDDVKELDDISYVYFYKQIEYKNAGGFLPDLVMDYDSSSYHITDSTVSISVQVENIGDAPARGHYIYNVASPDSDFVDYGNSYLMGSWWTMVLDTISYAEISQDFDFLNEKAQYFDPTVGWVSTAIPSGDYYLHIDIDPNDYVTEYNEDNNNPRGGVISMGDTLHAGLQFYDLDTYFGYQSSVLDANLSVSAADSTPILKNLSFAVGNYNSGPKDSIYVDILLQSTAQVSHANASVYSNSYPQYSGFEAYRIGSFAYLDLPGGYYFVDTLNTLALADSNLWKIIPAGDYQIGMRLNSSETYDGNTAEDIYFTSTSEKYNRVGTANVVVEPGAIVAGGPTDGYVAIKYTLSNTGDAPASSYNLTSYVNYFKNSYYYNNDFPYREYWQDGLGSGYTKTFTAYFYFYDLDTYPQFIGHELVLTNHLYPGSYGLSLNVEQGELTAIRYGEAKWGLYDGYFPINGKAISNIHPYPFKENEITLTDSIVNYSFSLGNNGSAPVFWGTYGLVLFPESERKNLKPIDIWNNAGAGIVDWPFWVSRIRSNYYRTITNQFDLSDELLTPGEYMFGWYAYNNVHAEMTYLDNADIFDDGVAVSTVFVDNAGGKIDLSLTPTNFKTEDNKISGTIKVSNSGSVSANNVNVAVYLDYTSVVSTNPVYPDNNDSITVYFHADASGGTGELLDYTGDVYANTGVILPSSYGNSTITALYLKNDSTSSPKASRVADNTYQLTIGNPYTYYGVPSDSDIVGLTFQFRNADGSKIAGDKNTLAKYGGVVHYMLQGDSLDLNYEKGIIDILTYNSIEDDSSSSKTMSVDIDTLIKVPVGIYFPKAYVYAGSDVDGAIIDTTLYNNYVVASGEIDIVDVSSGGTQNSPPSIVISNLTIKDNRTTSVPVLVRDLDGDSVTVAIKMESDSLTAALNTTMDTLTIIPTAGYLGTSRITFTLSDSTYSNITKNIYVTVTHVNGVPVITSNYLANVSLLEDGSFVGVVKAVDLDYDTLTYSATSNNDSIAVSVKQDTMTIVPILNWYGTGTISVYAKDTENAADTLTVSVTVVSVNDPPVVNAGQTALNIDEDTEYKYSITYSDVENDKIMKTTKTSNFITLSLTDTSYNALDISILPKANWNGVTDFTLFFSDDSTANNIDDGDTTAVTYTVTVNPVNDAPVIMAVANDSTDEETEKAIKLRTSDVDGDTLTYAASSDTSAVAVTVSTDTLKLTPTLNYTGTSVITVIVSDNVLSDTSKFDFKVININDSPIMATIANDTTSEDSDGKTLKLSASDIEGDTLTYTAFSDTTGLTVTVSNDTIKLKPVPDYFGTSKVTAVVNDGQLNDSTAFSFTVLNVQDAPYAFDWVSTASDSIDITQDAANLAEVYKLEWTESKDVDGETIDYLLYVKIGVLEPDEVYDTTSTSIPITYQEFVENVFEPFPMLPRVTVKFSVKATDGIDTVKVTGDDRVVFVNRYEYLSTEGEGIPTEFALHENYPNPFNPTTTLRFDLPQVSDVAVTIFNMLGQKVKTFSMQSIPAGYHSVTWDATNDYGEQVGAGVYLYQLQTKDFVKTRKMVLLK
jgi:flagellar hook assembly protein FlgD